MVNPKRDPDSDEEDEELVADGKVSPSHPVSLYLY
jgi:hypothetical protein